MKDREGRAKLLLGRLWYLFGVTKLHVTGCFMITHQQKTGGTSGSKGKEHVSLVYIYIYIYINLSISILKLELLSVWMIANMKLKESWGVVSQPPVCSLSFNKLHRQLANGIGRADGWNPPLVDRYNIFLLNRVSTYQGTQPPASTTNHLGTVAWTNIKTPWFPMWRIPIVIHMTQQVGRFCTRARRVTYFKHPHTQFNANAIIHIHQKSITSCLFFSSLSKRELLWI